MSASNSTTTITARISYARDIRPLLADSCFACHGADASQRKADLRLDERESAVRGAVVPGHADQSMVIERVMSHEADEQMPPPDSKKPPLSAESIAKLRRWIDQGAKYESHWAYTAPKRPPAPDITNKAWAFGTCDRFVAAVHEREKLHPATDADPRTLVRRLHFDLTGLPPTVEEVDTFCANPSNSAYERVVDRLLASPQFGERMAMYWLDVVRYADTCGYHSDNERSVWPYRDYVVRAFNDNMPFDRFTIEQLAGDLLPHATRDQQIASGYNKLLQTTEEGGAQPKEYAAKYLADRVRNTSTAWLGSTMGCCQCHDHKYDPFSMKDFYSLAAFFADVREVAVGPQEETTVGSPDEMARLAHFDDDIAAKESQLKHLQAVLPVSEVAWEHTLDGKLQTAKLPAGVAKALAVERVQRSREQKMAVDEYYRTFDAKRSEAKKRVDDLQEAKKQYLQTVPKSLVTVSVAPREVRLLPRGDWQNDSGPVMEPAVPRFLGTLHTKGRATRLDLAHWMTSPENPLVARVMVNRLWYLLFGQGIVKTGGDLGTQGALPSHPELLDWLAVEFRESGWNVKHMIKLMVMSHTYRQSSCSNAELDQRDPNNMFLARQGRFRLDAEMVRDTALSASGLLSLKLGGPTVKPYQPAGYWSFLNFPTREWQNDRGEGQYRRGLYTFWQRTFLHPSLLAFDAPTREECVVERARSNTPLQALALLNDPTYVEAARVLAADVIHKGGQRDSDRLQYLFGRVLQRKPTKAEADMLAKLHDKHLSQYKSDRAAAEALQKVGDALPAKDAPIDELAAWTSVARVMLNLHETICRD